MAVKIDYRVADAGWADCDVAIDGSAASVEASYLGDALLELIEATRAIVDGANYSVAHFYDEPGECRFVLEPQGDTIRVRILEFGETWSEEPDEAGIVRLEAVCPLQEFAEAVLAAASQVLNTHGLEGYKEKWVRHDFPSEAVYGLRRALQGETLH